MGQVFQVLEKGQRFTGRDGGSTVTEAEVRTGHSERHPHGYRYARLLCDCGTEYLAMISHLFHGKGWACPACVRTGQGRRRRARNRRQRGSFATVKRDTRGRGYNVTLYVGYFRTRDAAEDVARRVRPVLLPETPPRSL